MIYKPWLGTKIYPKPWQSRNVQHNTLIQIKIVKYNTHTYMHTYTKEGAVIYISSIKRARYCLQVTFCALYMELKDAVIASNSVVEPFEWLINQQAKNNEMCLYWKMVMHFQMQILILVTSIRECNFKLYVEVLQNVIKWDFVFDHCNYARWLSIHLFDLIILDIMHPDVYHNMASGFFSFKNTTHQFSSQGLDQIHKQNNCTIK